MHKKVSHAQKSSRCRVARKEHVIRIKNESHIKSDSHEQSESQAWGRTRGWLALRAQHLISSKAELGEQASCTSLFKWIDPGMVVVNTPRSDLHTMQSYLTSQMAHRAKAYLSFCRVKRLGALPPRPVLFIRLPGGGSLLTIYPHGWREVLGKSNVSFPRTQ